MSGEGTIKGNGHGNGGGSLAGRVALVTGAARGIGRAIALGLAKLGAAVAANYATSQAEAEVLVEQMRAMGVEALAVQGDVANRDDARRVVEAVIERWGRLDILVNNAGITRDKSLRKDAADEWGDVISVNLNGTYYCTSAAIPTMIAQQYGRIINISSYMGQAGNFGHSAYTASKGGVIAYTRALALEMAKYNITANAIAPGFTSTDMLSRVPESILQQIRAKIPLGRFAHPDEVAKAVAFLAADGDYITGQQINVNGGLYM